MGEKVLVIDADLRTPSQHKRWKIERQEGLAHALAEPLPESEFILPIHTVDEVDVLTTIETANPLKLLDSKQMSALITDQAQYYNYILLDTPPIASVVDALVLNPVTDGILLVARPGKLDRNGAQKALNALLQSESTVLGIVANGVSPKDMLTYDYAYGGIDRSQKDELKETITTSISQPFEA